MCQVPLHLLCALTVGIKGTARNKQTESLYYGSLYSIQRDRQEANKGNKCIIKLQGLCAMEGLSRLDSDFGKNKPCHDIGQMSSRRGSRCKGHGWKQLDMFSEQQKAP